MTKELRHDISEFMAEQRGVFTREQWSESYQSWSRGGNGWNKQLGIGGTDTQSVICWYQHVHKPASKEWRPRIIILAVARAAIDWRKAQQPASDGGGQQQAREGRKE